MDDVDRAQLRIEADLERAIEAARVAGVAEYSEACIECGDSIPLERQVAAGGVCRCADCASEAELRDRMRRGSR